MFSDAPGRLKSVPAASGKLTPSSTVNFDYQLFANEMTIEPICVGNSRKNQIQINSRGVARDSLYALPTKLCYQLINI